MAAGSAYILGACLGAQAGYLIGARIGPPLFADTRRRRLDEGWIAPEAAQGRRGGIRNRSS